MGLRDAFKSRRGERADEQVEEAAVSEVPDPVVFAPRLGGIYVATSDDAGAGGGAAGSLLTFLPGGRVRYAPAGSEADWQGPDGWVGDYTGAGRFTVQRRFERPVIFTVLSSTEDEFSTRCTDTGAGTTSTVRFLPRQTEDAAG